MQLVVPEAVLQVIKTLEDAGFETWCVGGAVRDHLMGLENHDFDLATAATPDQVQKLFPSTVPVGIEHGTVIVLDQNKDRHEVTTFRKDKDTDGRHAKVEFGVSLDDDLARRDFTINAIAYHPIKNEWRDPFNGRQDITDRVLRAVGDPSKRFKEDYLRILRLIRFSVRFEFVIDPATWDAAKAEAGGLRQLSAERVRDEWFGALTSARRPNAVVALWYEVGASDIWLPEIALTSHDLCKLRDPVLMTTYLSVDPGTTLRRLRCTKAAIARGETVAKLLNDYPDPTDAVQVRRWLSKVGKSVDDLVRIAQFLPIGSALADAIDAVPSTVPLTTSQLAVRGNELGEAGVPYGKMIGDVLRDLLDQVLENPELNTRDTLLKLAETYVVQHLPILTPEILEPAAPVVIGVDMASGPDWGVERVVPVVDVVTVDSVPAVVEPYCPEPSYDSSTPPYDAGSGDCGGSDGGVSD